MGPKYAPFWKWFIMVFHGCIVILNMGPILNSIRIPNEPNTFELRNIPSILSETPTELRNLPLKSYHRPQHN